MKLEFGDTLLVEGPVERMKALFAEKDFINLSKPKPNGRCGVRKAPIVLGALRPVHGRWRDASPELIPVLAMAAVLITLLGNGASTRSGSLRARSSGGSSS